MTKRAILWCGQVREPVRAKDEFGEREPTQEERELYGVGDASIASDDATIHYRSLELAYEAAQKLGVARGDIHACVIRDDLLPRGFEITRQHPATVEGLRRVVKHIAQQAKADDPLLFIAVNHCGQNALATAAPVDELDDDAILELLTPAVLDACLHPLSGPQVMVVATCHAGIFQPLGGRPNRVILAACAANEVYRIRRQDNSPPTFLDELFGAWCESSQSDLVDLARLSLDDAFARAVARLAAAKVLYTPQRSGTVVWPP